ncbi:MAG TPA: hypothetical protein VFB07_02125 [Vicinamibacterales bacterium]|nr:hypothetical protein [Vicinamibacterales bacterium]
MFATQLRAATIFDPALRFRTLTTDHFVISFHQDEADTAGRLAAIAEDTWRALQSALAAPPPRRTQVVLVDQTDLANGYATPIPYDTVVIYATWPAGSEFIGNVDDWLRVAFTHEFTHVVHLDRSGGWARVVRGVFGRTTLAFPNLFLPTWQVEGLATYEESAITGLGRVHAGDFAAVVDEAARAGAAEPIDRVNGGLTDWPAGNGPYAYGAGFHEYLARRFGAEALAALAERTARAVPYTGSRAFVPVFGDSLGNLWREYESTRPTDPPRVDGRQLTHHGFTVVAPRFDRESPGDVLYSVRNADAFPALYRVNVDTPRPEPVASRYLGSTTAPGRERIYFDQLEVRRNVGLYSDLYALDRTTGAVSAITRDARLMDPDLSPDQSTLVAVQDRPGRRDLVLLPLAGTRAVVVLASAPETQFNAPRWSPDGRTIAVERHQPGALPDIALVDVATRDMRSVAAFDDARVVTPAWRPDGRAVVAAVAREGTPFNLFEFSVDDGSASRQLTHTTGGATWPDVSPDGRTLAFVGYTASGFDLFAMPYPSGSDHSRDVAPGQSRGSASKSASPGQTSHPESVDSRSRVSDYSPLPTLMPTSWSPLVTSDASQLRAGALVEGTDVLGYHAYALSATWALSVPSGATTPPAATPDWQLTYLYGRWRPTLFASASTTTSFFAGPPTDAGAPSGATRRERQVETGFLLPIRHTRISHSALGSILRASDEDTLDGSLLHRDRTALRAAWTTTTAHTYGYSISPEDGIAAGMTLELVRRSLGAAADASTATADVRAYLRGAARHHVVALRAAGGSSTGDASVGRAFLLGGSPADLGVASFDSRAVGLLRGFPSNSFAGRRAAVVNADYRVPLVRPQRGSGTWPIFVDTVHAAAFVDAGDAWNGGGLRTGAIKTSAGGELAASIVAGYVFPFSFAVGAAWGHDPIGVVRSGATAYFRIGKAF